jgi:hypothetical protein
MTGKVWVEVEGLDEIVELLERMEPRDSKRYQSKALAEGGKYVKPKLAAETPWESYKRAVTRGAAKKDKPAYIVKYDAKKAPFRHIMVGGSRAHSTRPIRSPRKDLQIFEDGGITKYSRGHDVRGVTADNTIARTADRYGDPTLDRVEEYLVKAFGLDE